MTWLSMLLAIKIIASAVSLVVFLLALDLAMARAW